MMVGSEIMDTEPPVEPDEGDVAEVAPGLLLRDLGGGRAELLSVAYGLPLDGPPRPGHAEAVGLYCACACDRLAALVERGPGFRTDRHRRDLWVAMQAWARLVLAGRRAAAEDRERARRDGRALAATLARLRRDADGLRAAVTRRPEVVEALRGNAVATRALAQELRALSAALEAILRRRRPGRPAAPPTLVEALGLLADVYREATGRRPTVVVRERPGGRGHGAGGPSLAFAQAAIAPLFPEAGSLVDHWREVSRKMRAGPRR